MPVVPQLTEPPAIDWVNGKDGAGVLVGGFGALGVLVGFGLGGEVGLGLGVLVGGTGVNVGVGGMGTGVSVGGTGVKVAVWTSGVMVGVTGVGVLVGSGVSVGTGVLVGVRVMVKVGFGVLVGVAVGSDLLESRGTPEQANMAATMAIETTTITIRFLAVLIIPPFCTHPVGIF